MWECTNCGQKAPDNVYVCSHCRTERRRLSPEMYSAKPGFQPVAEVAVNDESESWECESCGANVSFEAVICSNCGADIVEIADDDEAVIDEEIAPLEIRNRSSPAGISDQAQEVTERYTDSYTVARALVGIGSVIKGIGVTLAILSVIIGFVIIGDTGLSNASSTMGVITIVSGIFAGMIFYIVGILVSAQGQILKASLDSAVNSSPFLTNELRAIVMSLPRS